MGINGNLPFGSSASVDLTSMEPQALAADQWVAGLWRGQLLALQGVIVPTVLELAAYPRANNQSPLLGLDGDVAGVVQAVQVTSEE